MISKAFKIDKLVILGLGLIGGSLALAARKAGIVGEIVAWGRREPSSVSYTHLTLPTSDLV